LTVKNRVEALPTALAVALVALPLVAAVFITFGQTGHALYPYGDQAIVQGETQRALHGHQMVGTYSRYGWDHPGPALFYWMAPFYALFGHSPAALNGAVALLNALALALLVAVVARCAGRVAAFFAAALALLLVTQLGPTIVRDFWIPHAVSLPFAALIVVTAAVASGRIMLLPFVAVLASFLAETDVSVVPATAVVVAVGALFFVLTHAWRGHAWTRATGLTVAGSALIAAVIWYPPVKQQLGPGPGNLKAIYHFLREPAPRHSLGDGIGAVANALATLWTGQRGAQIAAPASLAAKLLLLLTLVLLVVAVTVALRRGSHFAGALCALSLAAIATEIYAVTQIRDQLFTYLVAWFAATGIVAWLGIGCALGPPVAERLRGISVSRTAATLVAATAALSLVAIVQQARHLRLGHADPAYSFIGQKPVDVGARAWMNRNGVRDPVLVVGQPEQWPIVAGVYADQLTRDRPVAIDPGWLGVFGRTLGPTGHEDATIVLTNSNMPRPADAKGATVVARTPWTIAYALRR
jgi:hypothetical protein